MTLRILHISDTHIGATPDYLLYGNNTYLTSEFLVDYVNHQLTFEPDLILHTGDVCYDPDPIAAKQAHELLSQLKYPLYVVRGNHDDPDALRDHFPNLPAGRGRINYDFLVNDYHIIVLDTFGHVQPKGYIEPEQLEWLADRLENSTARFIVMVLHHPPVLTGNDWLDNRMIIENREPFFDVLAPYQAKIPVLLFGHIHTPTTHWYRGILCSSASAAFSQFIFPKAVNESLPVTRPGGFSLVTLDFDQVSILHQQLGDELRGH